MILLLDVWVLPMWLDPARLMHNWHISPVMEWPNVSILWTATCWYICWTAPTPSRGSGRSTAMCRPAGLYTSMFCATTREKKLGQSPDLLTMIRADASRLLLLDYAITVGCDYVEWTGIGPKKALQIIQSLSAQGGAGNTEALAGYLYCRSFVMFHLSLFCCR